VVVRGFVERGFRRGAGWELGAWRVEAADLTRRRGVAEDGAEDGKFGRLWSRLLAGRCALARVREEAEKIGGGWRVVTGFDRDAEGTGNGGRGGWRVGI